MQLLATKEFNGLKLDCYRDNSQEDTENAFWATREQIGQLLGYSHPRIAIMKIHNRNKERLDMFSKQVEVRTLFNGNQDDSPCKNSTTATVYNFKGLLEICRYSQQPNANAVIDVLWEIADEIRKHGIFLSPKVMEIYHNNPNAFDKLLDRFISSQEELSKLKVQIAHDQSYTTLGKIVMAQSGCVTFQEAAAFLSQHGIDIGQNRLFEHCRKKKWLCNRRGRQWNKPTKSAIDKGLLNLQISGKNHTITVITPGGLSHLTDDFIAQYYPLIKMIENDED